MKYSKEFKVAISRLPTEDKDKLILRLLKRDVVLANRLYFELVDTSSKDDKRKGIEKIISREVENFGNYYFSAGYLMMMLRDISGVITEHVKITKDKYGEVSLTLFMLNKTLTKFKTELLNETRGKTRKFSIYVIARSFKVLVLMKKMHKDLWIDFYDDLGELGSLIADNEHLMTIAIQHGFDVNWLINEDVPEDIDKIHKNIRDKGYLTTRVHLNERSYEG